MANPIACKPGGFVSNDWQVVIADDMMVLNGKTICAAWTALTIMAACAPMPQIELPQGIMDDAPYPVLLTRAEMTELQNLEGDEQAQVLALQARVRDLRRRAVALRGPVLGTQDTQFLNRAMDRNG